MTVLLSFRVSDETAYTIAGRGRSEWWRDSGTRCHAVVCVVCWQELYAYVNRTTRDDAVFVSRMTQNDVVRPEYGA